jgi:hypothetical protein
MPASQYQIYSPVILNGTSRPLKTPLNVTSYIFLDIVAFTIYRKQAYPKARIGLFI